MFFLNFLLWTTLNQPSIAEDRLLTKNLRTSHTAGKSLYVSSSQTFLSLVLILIIALYPVGREQLISKNASTLSNCMCNWVVGCSTDNDCCPGLQCNVYQYWSQCVGKNSFYNSFNNVSLCFHF